MNRKSKKSHILMGSKRKVIRPVSELAGWGRYPRIDSSEAYPGSASAFEAMVRDDFKGVARGLGRSYGDSSLSSEVLNTRYLNHFISFDDSSGLLFCEGGVSLKEIAETFLPGGWFLFVTPGTKFVTVGGAIASDVHGKNHHIEGSFSDYVTHIDLLTADGSIIQCSRDINPDIFKATCGGMGLTGIILRAAFRLKKVKSAFIDETIIKTKNVEELMDLFDVHQGATYSVAWIDCVSSGNNLGRSLLMLGEHADDGIFEIPRKKKSMVPFDFPGVALSKYSISLFNALYYRKVRKRETRHIIPYDTFFYPLDAIENWNRIYGKKGFLQYQFVIPLEAGKKGLVDILERIARSKKGSFLAVLKVFGENNDNYLSFPMKGYTLALDFKMSSGIFNLLNELDERVLDCGGRLYLSKDARMSPETFKKGYPEYEKFLSVKNKIDKHMRFKSIQSERLEMFL